MTQNDHMILYAKYHFNDTVFQDGKYTGDMYLHPTDSQEILRLESGRLKDRPAPDREKVKRVK